MTCRRVSSMTKVTQQCWGELGFRPECFRLPGPSSSGLYSCPDRRLSTFEVQHISLIMNFLFFYYTESKVLDCKQLDSMNCSPRLWPVYYVFIKLNHGQEMRTVRVGGWPTFRTGGRAGKAVNRVRLWRRSPAGRWVQAKGNSLLEAG